MFLLHKHTDDDAQMTLEVHRIEHRAYTMADNQMAANSKRDGYCLDVFLFFGDAEWSALYGGFTSYMAVDDAKE